MADEIKATDNIFPVYQGLTTTAATTLIKGIADSTIQAPTKEDETTATTNNTSTSALEEALREAGILSGNINATPKEIIEALAIFNNTADREINSLVGNQSTPEEIANRVTTAVRDLYRVFEDTNRITDRASIEQFMSQIRLGIETGATNFSLNSSTSGTFGIENDALLTRDLIIQRLNELQEEFLAAFIEPSETTQAEAAASTTNKSTTTTTGGIRGVDMDA